MTRVTPIFVALCLVHLRDVGATVKVLRKSLNVTDKRLAFWTESYTDAHLTYALCDNKHPETDDVKCTVIREKEPYGNDTYSCDVTLKRPHVPHDKEHLPQISVHPFGQKNVALVVWEKDEYLNFTVVQMDSCKVSEAGIHVGSVLKTFYATVVGHSDSFDVFFQDAAAVPCDNKLCKATIGADGKIINEPKPLVKKIVHSNFVLRPVVALDSDSSGNEYFYLTGDGNDYSQVLVKPDGTEKFLARHPKPSGMIAVSKKNNLLGVCYQLAKKFECSQYGFDGHLKLNTTITSDDKDLVYLDIYNLPNGGFYVFSAECEKRSDRGCADYPRFFIERIDANFTKTGPIIFQRFDKTFRPEVMSPLFYENDSKEVCFSLAATEVKEDSGRSELTANCFTDADFSK